MECKLGSVDAIQSCVGGIEIFDLYYWWFCHICDSLLLLIYFMFSSNCLLVEQRASESQGRQSKALQSKDEDEELDEQDEDEHGDTLCGACGENYGTDEFWICCDICEKWFHGKCVKITPARAEHIKQYKCPSCSNKRARP